MTLRPYPEYRDSGLPWLGEIPSHWEEKRSKYFLREVDERSQTGKEELLSVSHLTGVTPRSEKNVTMFKAESYVGQKLCRSGDLVINTMWAWMAALGVSNQTGIVSSSYGVYRPTAARSFVPEYLDHLLRTSAYVTEYYCRSTGIRSSRLRLYPDEFLDIPIVCPPREEQEKIVAYLSARDRRIARLIRAKQRLIELLTEQKQAIIHRAVTRGLDPDAKMRKTNLDWLPEVPEGWEVKPLKYLVGNVNNQTATRSNDEIYVALENIESWTGRISILDEPPEFDSQVKRFRSGDVLFGKLRPYLAKVARPLRSGVCVGELLVLRCRDHSILPEYLEVRLRSRQVIDLINSSTFGAKMPRADWGFIGNISLAFPESRSEQREILNFIASETQTIDKAIERARREIDLIGEYRTRLVSDVVTGRLDVRCTEPPKVEDIEDLPGIEEPLPPVLDDPT